MIPGKTIKPLVEPVADMVQSPAGTPTPEDRAKRVALAKQIRPIIAQALDRLEGLRSSVDRYGGAAKQFDGRFAGLIAETRKGVDGLATKLKRTTDKAALDQKIGAHPDLVNQCKEAQVKHRRLFEALRDFDNEARRFTEVPGAFPLVAQSFTKLAAIPDLKDERAAIVGIAADLGKLAKLSQGLAGAIKIPTYRAKMGEESGFTTPKTTVKEIASGAIGDRYKDLAKLHQNAMTLAQGLRAAMVPLFSKIAERAKGLPH